MSDIAGQPRVRVVMIARSGDAGLIGQVETVKRETADLRIECIALLRDGVLGSEHEAFAAFDRIVDVRAVGSLRPALATACLDTSAEFVWLLDARSVIAPGCLAALMSCAKRKSDAGAIAPKALDGDGRVRSAGGIVWSDSSRTPYGAGWADDDPRVGYEREIDYGASTCLLVRRAALDSEAFGSAAAGLDGWGVQLGFALRARGWQIRYCSQAVVAEAIEPASAHAQLQGRMQEAIAAKTELQARWGATCAVEQMAPCRRAFRARERSAGSPIAFVADHYLPDPDRDAGSRAILQTMTALQELGYIVKFWPANGVVDPIRRLRLERAGIELLAGDHWAGSIERFARYARGEIALALLSRPEVARSLAPSLREHGVPRLVYYGHDLHHRRMALRARVTGDHDQRAAAFAMRAEEREIWRGMDAVIYPSAEETRIAARTVGNRAYTVPLYAFHEEELTAPRQPATGVQLLFVAGFGHSPNEDAATWFVHEVFPKILAEHPGARLNLVGAAPTEAVRALSAKPGVSVLGQVSAEDLAACYRQATIAVVPLRFGAGVKLKVLEAMARGVPLVTTSVGAQGLPGADTCIRIANSASAFAQAVVEAVRNPDAARQQAARDYVRHHYSLDALRRGIAVAIGSTSHLADLPEGGWQAAATERPGLVSSPPPLFKP